MSRLINIATGALMILAPVQSVYGQEANEDEVGSFDFTLAHEYFTSLQNSQFSLGSEVYQAFVLNADNAERYAGSEITSVNITAGTYKDTKTNNVRNITVFLSEGLEEEPFYTQSGRLGEQGEVMYKIDLDTPYVIEAGKQVVVGYYFRLSSEESNYITVDGVYHESRDGGWVGCKRGTGKISWINVAGNYGNLCMGCTIRGKNMPKDGVALLSLDGSEYAEPWQNFPYTIYFQNTATNDVTSLEVKYSVGESSPHTETVQLENALGYNDRIGLRYSNLRCSREGVDIPVNFEITKVNGNPNISPDKSRTAFINCFRRADGYDRVHIIEEGTGTWCQWCPAGIVMMEYLAKTYPDSYARVAVHSNDRMAVSSTGPVIDLFPGFPCMIVDRSFFVYPQNIGADKQIQAYTEYYATIPALAGVTTLDATRNEDGQLEVNAGVTFGLGIDGPERYRLLYYITENGLGPYLQDNSAYCGGDNGPMGGWENLNLTVETIFDDVARYLEGGVNGIENSVPGTIEKGTEYKSSALLSLKDVTSYKINLIAFIIDGVDGHVVNSAQKEIDLTANSIEEVSGISGFKVQTLTDGILVEGEFGRAEVFTMSGLNVGVLTESGKISVNSGIYIVNVDGKAVKVMVK